MISFVKRSDSESEGVTLSHDDYNHYESGGCREWSLQIQHSQNDMNLLLLLI